MVNKVVPLASLEEETLVWCREMMRNSPTALRMLKSALNATEDGHAGLQQLGGDATLLFYQSRKETRAAMPTRTNVRLSFPSLSVCLNIWLYAV